MAETREEEEAHHVLIQDFLTVLVATEDGRVAVQEVDLLQREAFRLGNAEVDEAEANAAESSPDEEHLGSQVGVAGSSIDEVRSDNSNYPAFSCQ